MKIQDWEWKMISKDKMKRSKSNFERDSLMFLGASKLSKGGAMVGSRVNLINYNINEYLP